MDINDVFGDNTNRPTTQDFWRMSSIVLALDGSMEEAHNDTDRQAVWDKALTEAGVDSPSLAYVGMQRAFRVMRITKPLDLLSSTRRNQVLMLITLYMEAFIVGARYERERP